MIQVLMPFTLAHPAAILPLTRSTQRGDLAFSALVIGSMAPDFPYFLHFPGDAHSFGHTWPGVFLFDVPAGLAALWLLHRRLKFPLLSLFPASHQERLIPIARGFRFWPRQRLAGVLLALIVGSLTHLVWDSFTHDSGWPVQQLPGIFLAHLEIPLCGRLLCCDLLQYGSGGGGCAVLLYAYSAWFRRAPHRPIRAELVWPERTRLRLLLGMGCHALLWGLLYGYRQACQLAGAAFHGDWLKFMVRYTVLGGVAVLVVELIIYSEVWQRCVMQQHRDQRQAALPVPRPPR